MLVDLIYILDFKRLLSSSYFICQCKEREQNNFDLLMGLGYQIVILDALIDQLEVTFVRILLTRNRSFSRYLKFLNIKENVSNLWA